MAGYYLECTTAGTSGSSELTISSPSIGGTVSDGTVVWTVMKNLPLSGGAMIGNNILKTSDNSELLIGGASAWYNGAHIILKGKDINEENKGVFTLVAALSQNNTKLLQGHPDGRLSWANNDLAGSAIVAKSINKNGYIEFASGLIIQWFRSSSNAIESRIDSVSTAYPLQFPKEAYCGAICSGTRVSELAIATVRTFTGSTDKVTWYPATYTYNDTNPTWNSGWRGDTFAAYFIVFGH